MKKPLLTLASAFALTFVLLIAAALSASATSMTVTPWTYYRGESFGEGVHGTATSQCTPAGLHLAKAEETSGDSAAGATIGGVNGIVLSDLGVDILAESHFSGGAPRFNVRTGEGDADQHFYGAAAATAVGGAATGYQRYSFDLTKDGANNGGTGDKQITSINVVFDEGPAEAVIKNIDINDNILNCVVAVSTTPTPSPTTRPSATPAPSVVTLPQTGGGTPTDSTSPWQAFLGLGLVVFLIGGGMLLIHRLRRT